MNTRMSHAAAVAALGLACAWTARADETNCVDGQYNDSEAEQAAPATEGGDDSKQAATTPTTSADLEILVPETRYFDYEVHHGKTKMSFRIKERGMLKFKNKSRDKILTIKSEAKLAPFDVEKNAEPRWEFTVNPKDNVEVTIDEAYVAGTCFTYSSQIGGSEAEDPIVIIEPR